MENGEAAASKEEKNDGLLNGRNMIILASIVALAAIVYFVFLQRPPAPAEEKPVDLMQTPEVKLFVASFENIAKAEKYQYKFRDNSSGMEVVAWVMKDGGDRAVRIRTSIDERIAVALGNMSVVCERLLPSGAASCADAKNSTVAGGYLQNAMIHFIDIGSNAELERNRGLIRIGAMGFKSGIRENFYGGVACNEVAYAINYSKLSISQLEEIGLDPRNSAQTGFGEYARCMEPGSLFPTRVWLKYTYKGQSFEISREYYELNVGAGMDPAVAVLAQNGTLDSELFEAKFREAQGELRAFAECGAKQNSTQRDACYSSYAVSNEIGEPCSLVEDAAKMSRCYMMVAGKNGEIALCERASGFRDECYAEAARTAGNAEACGFVANETLRGYCIEGARENENASSQYFQECRTDGDCGIPAGCSDVCVRAGLGAAEVGCTANATNACYPMTSCGCVGGTCSWKPNLEYRQCMDDVEFQRTADELERMRAERKADESANQTGDAVGPLNGTNATGG
jgi:hypothetical protein